MIIIFNLSDGDAYFKELEGQSWEIEKTLFAYNWRIKKYKIFMENVFNNKIVITFCRQNTIQ